MNHLVTIPLPIFAAICVLATAGLGVAFVGGLEFAGGRRRGTAFDIDDELSHAWDPKGARPEAAELLKRVVRVIRLERMQVDPIVERHELSGVQASLDDLAHAVHTAPAHIGDGSGDGIAPPTAAA